MVMEAGTARIGQGEVEPSQRAPPRAPAKRKADEILTIDSATDTDSEEDRPLARDHKGKGKAVARAKHKARISIVDISSDEDDAPLATASASSSTHQPDPSGSPPQSISKQEAVETILAIIPDIELRHLDELLDQQVAGPGSAAQGARGYDVGQVVDRILTRGNYPKEGQAEREAQAEAERDAKVDWLDLSWRGDGKKGSVQYKEQA